MKIKTSYIIKPVVYLFLIVQALDIITTLLGVHYHGLVEQNPLHASFGLNGFILYKTIAVLAIAGILQIRNMGKWFEWILLIVVTLPVVWNTVLLITG